MVAVVFDYRYFGGQRWVAPSTLDVAAQSSTTGVPPSPGLAPWTAWNPDELVGWGTSPSGGHVITLAGTGAPLAAIIAQVPHLRWARRRPCHRRPPVARLLPAALEDTVRALFHRPPRGFGGVWPDRARS